MAQLPTTTTRPATDASLPTLVQELWDLVLAYVRQETVEPLKGLGRFVGFGVAGSLLVGIGVVLLLVAGLRVLQEETGTTFTGNWSWVPYVITLVGAFIVIGLAVYSVGRAKRRSGR